MCNLCGVVLKKVAPKAAEPQKVPLPSFEELAERQVALVRPFGVELDYSPASLFAFDFFFEHNFGARAPGDETWKPNDRENAIIIESGAYVGEVIRRAFDGRWLPIPGDLSEVLVVFAECGIRPFSRAFHHLRNGAVHSFGGLYAECCGHAGVEQARSDTSDSWGAQAACFVRLGRPDLAAFFARRGFALGINNPRLTGLLASLEAEAPPPEPPPAPTPAEKPVAVDTTRYRREARAKLKQGDLEGALAAFTKHLEGTPGERDSTIDRAMVLSDLKRYDEAVRGLDSVLKRDPTDLEALDGKSITLTRANRIDEALLVSDAILSQHPRRTATWRQRSNMLLRKGDDPGALQALDQALTIADEPETWYLRGLATSRLHRDEEAHRSFRRAIELAMGKSDEVVQHATRELVVLELMMKGKRP
jgi:tetratricopeptide (TPR) repeat protein